MAYNVAQKLIKSHLVSGEMVPGQEIGIKIDQTLCQDATGTLVMLELEAMGVKKVKTEVSAQYVDHNLVQNDFKNADDHIFLLSACEKFGIWYSRPGNGVSHPVHMENFGIPGKTLIGSDSHTCAAGSMGMLAIGAGGLEVAIAMAGEPFYTDMPTIVGVHVTGKMAPWVSAKDAILEILRRLSVKGGVNKIFEYFGEGLKNLSAMDRHVIANMGAELGATATVFPSDERTKEFLEAHGRAGDYKELVADKNATYDKIIELNLSDLEPMIALPSSPDLVKPVREVAGKEIFQSMIGSSANPGLRDFAIASLMVKGKTTHPRVSFDINPSSRLVLENLTHLGLLDPLVHAGGRIHQAGCNGCIGMGQAPASGNRISLRTVPRNFKGRSGTNDDAVYLCSPEVAAASALTGVITDPRTLGIPYPCFEEPKQMITNKESLVAPDPTKKVDLVMGPNIKTLPKFSAMDDGIMGPVLLKMGDNISTDDISPAGSLVLPFRSNIPEIAKFTFHRLDETFYERAIKHQDDGFILIGGENYGQGSSREHAALAPRYLGLRAVIAKSYARIHRKNLINFGVLPLEFIDSKDYEKIKPGDVLDIKEAANVVKNQKESLEVYNETQDYTFKARIHLSVKEREEVLAGGLINIILKKLN